MERQLYEVVLRKIRQVLPSAVLFAAFAMLSFTLYANDSSGQAFTTEYSITAKNKQLSDVLYSISKQTGVEFLFSPEGIQSNRKVDYYAENKTVKSFLDDDLKSFGIEYEIISNEKVLLHPANQVAATVVATETTASQQDQDKNEVTGKVINVKGEPIEFVTVHEKGTTNGVYSEQDGTFKLKVINTNATLVFSSIGFESQEIVLNGRTSIDITLKEEANMLDEVIAVGYSSKTRAELSSSITTLKADQLLDVTTSDMGSMLQGKAAGVFITNASGQPGARAEIRIRGTGSITAEADPLYVVDGIIGGDFNPNDVETLTVLKDAGATAMYGSAAAGGVIIVTTKQAALNQKTQVNFKASSGIKNVTHGNFELMNGRELYKAHRSMMSEATFAAQRPNVLAKRDFNWLDAAFNQGYVQNYYASISGKNDKMGYYISADYYNEDGTLINTGYRRLNTRGNFNFQLSDRVKLNTRIAISNAKTDGYHYSTLEDAYRNLPWDYPYDVNGSYIKISGSTRPDGSTWYSNSGRNFLHNELYNYERSVGNSVMADAQLIWNINNWLTFESANRASFGYDKYKEYVDPRTYSSEWSNGYLAITDSDNNAIGTTNLLRASKSFGDHAVSGFAGMEASQWKSEFTSASGTDIPAGLSSLTSTIPKEIRSNRIPGKGLSFLGQAQYSYKNKLFATASFRADASSVFGKENRWGYFPSASGSWLMSNEDFIKEIEWVSFLKVRASYGVTGNSNIPAFNYLSNYLFGAKYWGQVGAIPERLANPALGWESAHMSNIGVDFGILKNRINLSIDVYSIDNKDLLLNVPEPLSTGFEYTLKNAGSVRNQGIEFQIETSNINKSDFKWNTSFNIAFNKNKVMELPNGDPIIRAYGQTSVIQEIREGRDIYTWLLPKWLGVDPENGDPLWEKIVRDTDGNIIERKATNIYTEAEAQDVGKATPVFSGGINNTLSYKGISLGITCNFVYGNKIYNLARESFDADGAFMGNNMVKLQGDWSRWEKPGDMATHPKLVAYGNKESSKTSSRYLEDGSFFRIRNITLGYDLPTKWISKLKISKFKIFASGDNLFTFTKFSGMDPEVSLKSGAWTLAGLYTFQYPISRQFIFGVDIYF